MLSNEYDRLRSTFLEAFALDHEERSSYLDQLGQENPALTRQVKKLLGHEVASRAVFEHPLLHLDHNALLRDSSPVAARNVGDFEIHDLLGAGGMGVVYRARQLSLGRWVALKVIHPARARRDLVDQHVERFRREAEALARMQHPNIAQIYDAGVFDDGFGEQPYIAMELVEGTPIDQFIDRNKLGIRERVALLCQVCQAVEHIHSCGIIHRDLKPENVLVEEGGRPRVLDFGVSRMVDRQLLGRDLSPDSELADFVVGTLAYASPEQLSGGREHVDVRADVFSLGVISYRVLVGALPISMDRSMPLASAIELLTTMAPQHLRSIDPQVEVDLEYIVMSAVAPELEKRYRTVAELRADFLRYLRFEPISLRTSSRLYRVRRFLRRNRALCTVAAVVLTAVVVGVFGLVDANRQSRLRLKQVSSAEDMAQLEAQRAREALTFLSDILAAPRVENSGPEVLLSAVVDDALEHLDRRFAADPIGKTQVRKTLALTLRSVGRLAEARDQMKQVYTAQSEVHGETHPQTLDTMFSLGVMELDLGSHAEASTLLHRVLDALGSDADSSLALNAALNLALVEQSVGELTAARQRASGILQLLDAQGRSDDVPAIVALSVLAGVARIEARWDDVERLGTRGLEISQRVLGASHPKTLRLNNVLSASYVDSDQLNKAEPLLREALVQQSAQYGENHVQTARILNNLATCLFKRAEYSEAAEHYQRAHAIYETALGAEHRRTLIARVNLAGVLREQGDFAAAHPLLDSSIACSQAQHPTGHWITGAFIEARARLLAAEGEHQRARSSFLEAMRILGATLGEESSRYLAAKERLREVEDILASQQ